MSTTTNFSFALVAMLCSSGTAMAADSGQSAVFGFGNEATKADLARFVSPLPDGRGMPVGSGSVAQGKKVYEAHCLACHGQKLEGGVGDKLIGGRGSLVQKEGTKGAPVKTVESYWPYATTLYDYVLRAMPLTAPGSLSHDDVYAVSAYILSEAGIVPKDTVLDQDSLPAVKMPNADGFISDPRPETYLPQAETSHSRWKPQ